MFGHVYTGRRVFVTGHTGFKGSWLTAWLLRLGAEVAGFSDGVPTTPSHYDVLGLADSILDRRGDVRDRAGLGKAMRDFRPEIVFHLAAQPLVRAAYADPAATIETNALGTLNLLEAVRATPSVQAVVCITSDKAYRNDEQVWGYRENDHLGGADPYSASKGCAEIIAHSYFASFFGTGPRCATTRAGNVIGGGDWAADRIVPDCARAWFAGEAAEIRNKAVAACAGTALGLSAAGRAPLRLPGRRRRGGPARRLRRFSTRGRSVQLRPVRRRRPNRGRRDAGIAGSLAGLRHPHESGSRVRHEGINPAQTLLRQGPGLSELAGHA